MGLQLIHFLHHHDRTNQGDVLSGPYHYFDFGQFDKISWDKQILKNEGLQTAPEDSVVMGGGIYFTRDKPRFDRLVKNSRFFIGWGLGLDKRLDLVDLTSKFSLLGTRERTLDLIDNQRIFYVPCVSCMNPAFEDSAVAGATASSNEKVALHLNGGFNKAEILEALESSSFPTTTTVDPFSKTIENLQAADLVITNSYHGAYWSSLLGKKVICIKTDVPKWDGLHENIIFSDVESLASVRKEVENVPADYRVECRNLNGSYFERVKALLTS